MYFEAKIPELKTFDTNEYCVYALSNAETTLLIWVEFLNENTSPSSVQLSRHTYFQHFEITRVQPLGRIFRVECQKESTLSVLQRTEYEFNILVRLYTR